MLSGYGKVDMTGTLDVCGQVVANGQGTDRTLNLTSFGAILDSDDSAPGGAAPGWYAQDHGRLVLRLQPSQNGTSLEWGEDPADPTLNMVNAVRLSEIETAGNQQPVQLSLLAADRDDIPSLSTLDGVPVGLWEIDPSLEEIDSAELTIRYNDAAVLALGDSESELSLWTLGDGSWEPVDPSGVTLDTEDHTISGVAEDFQYFAVAAPVGNGADISNLIAVPNNQFAPTTGQVPEPVGLGTLALLAGLLGRRRRR
jgi:MYXO-CTERM domain-containing protein